ncbi:hypothetical protein A6P54_12920 [Bacillus sp. MKU004]|nr:hypothetical protein A6P54_12920 [Bacillus sp. MKU004]
MMKPIVDRHISKMIVPFQYSGNYHSAIERMDTGWWKVPEQCNRENLFSHIDYLIADTVDSQREGTIGRRFELTKEGYKSVNLPANISSKWITINKKGQTFRIKLKCVNLYLFETNVGFITFDLEHPKGILIDEYILANNTMKNLKPQSGTTLDIYMGDKAERIPFTFSKLVQDLAGPMESVTYFDNIGDQPIQGIVFNAVILDSEGQCPNDMKRYLFELRRAFKPSYQPSPVEFKIEENEEIYQAFENSFWGVSLEGAANLVYLKNNQETDTFFQGNYLHNIKTTYFYLFMLTLHQRYSLLYINGIAAKLPRNEAGNGKTVTSIRDRMIFFTLRSAFQHVSTITHQNKLYDVFQSTLQVDRMMDELHFELETLEQMAELKKTKERNRMDDYLVNISSIFVFISTISAIWTMLIPILNGDHPAVGTNDFYIMISVYGVVCIIGFVMYLFVLRKLNLNK